MSLKNAKVLTISQYINPFTKQLGAIEVPRQKFMSNLSLAVKLSKRF